MERRKQRGRCVLKRIHQTIWAATRKWGNGQVYGPARKPIPPDRNCRRSATRNFELLQETTSVVVISCCRLPLTGDYTQNRSPTELRLCAALPCRAPVLEFPQLQI